MKARARPSHPRSTSTAARQPYADRVRTQARRGGRRERAVAVLDGMAAVILTIMTFMRRDGHIIFTSDCYRQTRDFAANLLAEFGIQVLHGDPTAEAIEKAIRPNTNIIFTESPTNPYLRCLDLPAVVKVAKKHNVKTSSTPRSPRPTTSAGPGRGRGDPLGHQVPGGHNDLLAGVTLGSDKLMKDVYRMQRMMARRPGRSPVPAGARSQDLRPPDETPQRGRIAIARHARSAPHRSRRSVPGLASHPTTDREGTDEGLRQRRDAPAQGR